HVAGHRVHGAQRVEFLRASDILLLLLPLRLVLDDLTPVGWLHIDDERILRWGLAPADGVAADRMVIAHGDRAVDAEWRVELHARERRGDRLAVKRVGLLDRGLVEPHRDGVLPRPVRWPLVPPLEVGLAP